MQNKEAKDDLSQITLSTGSIQGKHCPGGQIYKEEKGQCEVDKRCESGGQQGACVSFCPVTGELT